MRILKRLRFINRLTHSRRLRKLRLLHLHRLRMIRKLRRLRMLRRGFTLMKHYYSHLINAISYCPYISLSKNLSQENLKIIIYHSNGPRFYVFADSIPDFNFAKDSWRLDRIFIDVYDIDLPTMQKRKQEQFVIENHILHFVDSWKIHQKLIAWDFWSEFSDFQFTVTESFIDSELSVEISVL